jgi:hypothetical protein
MDYKTGRLLWSGPLFLLGIKKGEGPNHGEDGNYAETDERKAAAQNIAVQNAYLDKAVAFYRQTESLRRAGEPVHEIGTAAKEMFNALGDACHVAQDRGSHWEGVKGRGHDDPRKKKGWDPDNPSDNAEGYRRAILNTIQLFNRWRELTLQKKERTNE